MNLRHSAKLLPLFALVLALAVAGWSTGGVTAQTTPVDLHFITFTQLGLPEQDVFVETGPAGQVMRVEGDQATANAAKSAFASTNAVAHDPFKLGPNPLGPFPKGAALNLTLQQWLAASGSGTYNEAADNASLTVTFQKLVPNGTYSVWCVRLSFPPNYREVYTACGAADGSQNVFKADAQGNGTLSVKLNKLAASHLTGDFAATFQVTGVIQSVSADAITLTNGTVLKLNPGAKIDATWQAGQTVTLTAGIDNDQLVLVTETVAAATPAATPEGEDNTATVIELVYHSDAKTRGAQPGDFGLTSHVQLLAFLPGPGIEGVMLGETATAATAEANCAQTKNIQPVAARLADAFGVSYDEIMLLHCRDHYGFGEIARAYLLAKASGKKVADIFAMRQAGQGWGQIVKSTGVSPKDLAPGSVINQGNKDNSGNKDNKGGPTPNATQDNKGKGNG